MSDTMTAPARTQYWLVLPEDLTTVEQYQLKAERRIEDLAANPESSEQNASMVTGDFWSEYKRYRPYMVHMGTLTIPVSGVLLNKFPLAFSFATGYEYIEQAVMRGMEDEEVEEIVFDIDSPGGLVAGCFELTNKITAMRGVKPMTAKITGGGYSAAYALASAADEIVMTLMAGVGSVGVVTTHMDLSKMLDNAGVKVTYIFAGKHKVDGNPFEPLPDEVKDRMQKRINRTYGIFTQTVAENRGISVESVKNTEALTFSVEEAIENKFADRMDSPEEDDQSEETEDLNANDGDEPMATPKKKPASAATNDTPAAVHTDEDLATAKTEATTAERQRFADVLASDNYAGRETLATHLLSTTSMSAADIDATLAASPKAQPAAAPATEDPATAPAASTTPGADFNAAMQTGNPEVGSAEPPAPKSKTEERQAELRSFRERSGL